MSSSAPPQPSLLFPSRQSYQVINVESSMWEAKHTAHQHYIRNLKYTNWCRNRKCGIYVHTSFILFSLAALHAIVLL